MENIVNNSSVLKSELRTKYRKAHGPDWWRDPEIKLKYSAELNAAQKLIRLKDGALCVDFAAAWRNDT